MGGKTFTALASQNLSLKELTNYPLISLSDESMTRSFYRQLFLDHDAELKPDTEAATTDQMLTLVKSELGLAFVPEPMAGSRCSGEIVQLHLQEIIPPLHLPGLRPPPPAEHGGPEVPADDHPDDGTACMMFSHKESASAQILCTGTFWFFVTSYAVRCFLSAPGALPAAPVSGHG